MALKVVNFQGKAVKDKQIPATFTPKSINQNLIWEVIKAEQANQRQGTHKTKTKPEVSGGGAKPWRQKGTGRARQGSTRNPQWRGGGIAFGPLPRDYREAIPKRKKQNGIRHILADKISSEKVVLLDTINLEAISAKAAFDAVKKIVAASPFAAKIDEGRKVKKSSNDKRRNVTIITASEDEKGKKSFRNIPWVDFIHVNRLPAQSLFFNHGVIITEEAFDLLAAKCEKAAGKK